MSDPLVSVIIPAYNGAGTIRETLDSVFAQTFTDYEIVVVDDASTDDTAAVAAGYGERVRVIRRAKNSGICEVARSEGISAACGRYCAFIDQDDLWDPTKLEKQVAFMEAHPELPLSHTAVRVIDENGRVLEVRHEGRIPPTGPCAVDLLHHCFITISSIVVRGTIWRDAWDVGSLTEPNSDIEYFLSILQRHPAGFGFLPEVLGSYRRWSRSISRQDWRRAPEDVNALERVYRTTCWHGLVTPSRMRGLLADAYATNAEYHRQAGQPGRAWFFVRRGLHHAPLRAGLYGTALKAAARAVLKPSRRARPPSAGAPPTESGGSGAAPGGVAGDPTR